MQKLACTIRTKISKIKDMHLFNSSHRRCYCAFCRRPRKAYVKRHLAWTDVMSCVALTALSTAVIWRGVSPKAILILVSVLIVAEMIVQLRWRMSMPCPNCGFDPLLYVRNPDLAARQVRRFYEQRRERADFLLTGQALIETQKRIREAQAKRKPKPRIKPSDLLPSEDTVRRERKGKGLARTV